MQVTRRFLASLVVVFASVLEVASAPAAQAAAPAPASGSFAATIAPVGTRSADGNTFIDFTFVEQFEGTLSGTRLGTGRLVIHPDGTVNVRDSGLFSGSIGGATGTAILSASISGTFGSIAANFVVADGTDGLSGIHVEGTAAG
ncbi:MAG TPA: hypothetical protein VHW94_13230, partial [Candidatus Dormibacteraeota bacterium]|nr:hypothetical protein [Candidatus Dormibacteraeota bacterium]